MMIQIAPSILSADFSKLGEEILRMDKAGADMIHIDVMDGVFVPNLTIGLPVVKSIRKTTKLPFDVHLMIVEPHRYAVQFVENGADFVTFHLEAESDPAVVRETLCAIRRAGAGAGLAIKPATPAEALLPYLELLDLVLVMTVEPGFGNQKLMPDCLKKVSVLRAEAEKRGLHPVFSIDGGMNLSTAPQARDCGITMAVAGSAVFGADDPAERIRLLRGENPCGKED